MVLLSPSVYFGDVSVSQSWTAIVSDCGSHLFRPFRKILHGVWYLQTFLLFLTAGFPRYRTSRRSFPLVELLSIFPSSIPILLGVTFVFSGSPFPSFRCFPCPSNKNYWGCSERK